MPEIKELVDAVEGSDMESEVKAEIGEILETYAEEHNESLIYCTDCGIGLKEEDNGAIQIRTGCIDKDGNFEADGKDVAYYHVDCFNRVTGQKISPAKKK